MVLAIIISGFVSLFIVSDFMYKKIDKDKEGSDDFTDYWDEKIDRIGRSTKRK